MHTILTLTHPSAAFPGLLQHLIDWYAAQPPDTVQMHITADDPESETGQVTEILKRYFPYVVVPSPHAGGPDGS
jgi:hypothetical protein